MLGAILKEPAGRREKRSARPSAKEVRAAILGSARMGQIMLRTPLWDGRQRLELICVSFVARGARPPRSITVQDKISNYSRYEAKRQRPFYPGDLGIHLPHLGISARWWLSIPPDVDGSGCSSEDEACRKINLHVADTNIECDDTLSQMVDSSAGLLEVRYAVLSNAVEAKVHVKLISMDGTHCEFFGKISAFSELLMTQMVLFYSEDDRKINIKSGEDISLDRSELAVPLIYPFSITLNLHVETSSVMGTVAHTKKESVHFFPDLDGAHEKEIVWEDVIILVEIIWSNTDDIY